MHVVEREERRRGDPVVAPERLPHARQQEPTEEQLLAEHRVEHRQQDGGGG
jgi:hypothetical protein